MGRHALDSGVFIRSMGSRGNLGGLARATREAARVLDAAGFEVIVIETVGVGQSEVEIMHLADTVALVLTPGSGDAVQVFKAGIMETADLFVVNKADREGAARLVRDIEEMLSLVKEEGDWIPPILRTEGKTGRGIDELWSGLQKHRQFLQESGQWEDQRRTHLRRELETIIEEAMRTHLLREMNTSAFQKRFGSDADSTGKSPPGGAKMAGSPGRGKPGRRRNMSRDPKEDSFRGQKPATGGKTSATDYPGGLRPFVRKGFHKTTTREIARECGLSIGTMYEYIQSKEDVLYLVCDYIHSELESRLKSALAETGSGREGLTRPLPSIFA